jgi:hypothetical protein
MNAQSAYAGTTQMSTLLQSDALAGQHPGREGDGRQGQHAHAETDAQVPGENGKSDANPAHFPSSVVGMTTGAPEGGASPARSVRIPPRPAARRAARHRIEGGAARSAGDELVEPNGLTADHVKRIARDL